MELRNVIIEVRKHIDFIEGILDNLEKEQKGQEEQEIDITRIEQFARQSAFKLHFLRVYDEDVAVKYCTLLASYVRFAGSMEKKVKQYYFLSRILYSVNSSKGLEEVITGAELAGIKDFEIIMQELKNDIKLFLFDILLMISLDGNIDEKQLSYFCETLAYTDMDRNDLECLCNVCSCVLSGDEYELYYYAYGFPIVKLSCYLPNPIKGEVVISLDELKKAKEMDVMVTGANIQNMELDLDTYGKKHLRFFNCKFENVSSIRGIKTEVVFEGCYFVDCKKEYELPEPSPSGLTTTYYANEKNEYALFSFVNADFVSCSFKRCSHINHNVATILLKMDSGKIEDCNFMSCSVGSSGGRIAGKNGSMICEYGALIYVDKVSVINTKYQNCIVKGNGRKSLSLRSNVIRIFASDCQYLNLIYCNGGNIKGCEFLWCECSGLSRDSMKRYNYLINSIGALERNNKFIECTASSNTGTAKWEI